MKAKDLYLKLKNIIFMHKYFCLATVFFILLLIASGFWIFGGNIKGSEEAAKEIVELSQNIRKHYQNRPDFWGLNTQMVLDKKIYPNKMLQNEKLTGFFGNPVQIGNGASAEVLMPGARNFDIIYTELNKAQCKELLTFEFGSDFWLGVRGISVISDGNEHSFSWNSKENTLPISKRKAALVCKENSNIIWHFEQ